MSKIEIKYTQLFINNEFVNSASGKTFPVVNPATEEKLCEVQEAGDADCELAIKAAREAFDNPNVKKKKKKKKFLKKELRYQSFL
jgi:acyl-CoA reductase-like NAD-dependent aldehyde dehydrogenase